jgi:hypothetical protein
VRFDWTWPLTHPRMEHLSDQRFRAWFALVASAVRRDEPDGRFVVEELDRFLTPRGMRAVTQADVDVFHHEVGLVETIAGDQGAYRVRDWSAWSPLDATRVYRDRAYRERLALTRGSS